MRLPHKSLLRLLHRFCSPTIPPSFPSPSASIPLIKRYFMSTPIHSVFIGSDPSHQNYPPPGQSQYYPPPPTTSPPGQQQNYPPPPPSGQPQYQPPPQQSYPPPGAPQQFAPTPSPGPQQPPQQQQYGGPPPSQQQHQMAQQQPMGGQQPQQQMVAASQPQFVGVGSTAADDVGTFNGGSYRISHRDTNSILTVQLAMGCPLTAKPGMSPNSSSHRISNDTLNWGGVGFKGVIDPKYA